MNKIVKLSVVLALLACGVCKADEAGLCKPMCEQEKRQCRSAAAKLVDHDAQSLMKRRGIDQPVRYFGPSSVKTDQPAGPEVRNAQQRRMTRNRACDDSFAVCTKACSTKPATSDILVKPAK